MGRLKRALADRPVQDYFHAGQSASWPYEPPSGPIGEQAMQDNKAIAIRWLESVGSGDVETFKSLVTDDVVHEVMGTSVLSGVRTLDALVELAAGLFQSTKNGLRFN